MKKVFFALFALWVLSSCATRQSFDLSKVGIGMEKDEFVERVGKPVRFLSSAPTKYGVEEVWEFRTEQKRSYALKFVDNILAACEPLYGGVDRMPFQNMPEAQAGSKTAFVMLDREQADSENSLPLPESKQAPVTKHSTVKSAVQSVYVADDLHK